MIPYEWPQVSDWPDMPSHVAAEQAILGHILLDNKSVPKDLTAEDFSLESHQVLWTRMGEMLARGSAVDIVTLSNYLAGKTIPMGVDDDKNPLVMREIDDIGGTAYLVGLTEGLIWRGAVDEYVEIVKEKARLRRIWAACEQGIRLCREQGTTAAEIVEQLGVALKGIRRKAGK